MTPGTVTAPAGAVHTRVLLPWSKSLLNRSLLLKALAGDNHAAAWPQPDADRVANDCRVLYHALTTAETTIDLADAGTPLRLFLAYAALHEQPITLTGTERLQQRPLQPLITALRALGAHIRCTGNEGFLPLEVSGPLHGGVQLTVDASQSSQFLSALACIAPALPGGLTLQPTGNEVSASYTRMTLGLLEQWGIHAEEQNGRLYIPGGHYTPGLPLVLEADWSAASYWFLLTGLMPEGSTVQLEQLPLQSLQGDAVAAEWFAPLGIQAAPVAGGLQLTRVPRSATTVAFDCTHNPDLVPALVVLCAATGTAATFTGVAHLELKESKRITALQQELRKVGADIRITGDGSFELPACTLHPAGVALEVHNDHRMAMSLAALSLLFPVHLDNKDVVSKSYPAFWKHLETAGWIC